MNSRQKLVQKQFLNNEEAVIKRLNQVYGVALNDITSKIEHLQLSIDGLQLEYDWMDPDDPKRAQVKSMIQSKIYQKNYQEALQGQVEGILNQMKTKQFLTVSDYLNTCYEDGFVGSIFDLHGQGVPMMMPLDQTKMVRAVQLDSKISKGLYTRLGEDVDLLKKKITAQVSRSISTGASYAQTAKQLAGYTRIGYNNAVRIARTEGHRIQCNAAMDVMEAAKAKGADVVKQWDATLDDRTREEHVAMDGEIREVDEKFSNGLMFPGDPAGEAADVINCRCALLQRARWNLGEDELQTLKDRAEYFGLDKTDQFDDFKKKYMKATAQPAATVPVTQTAPTFTPAASTAEAEEYAKQFVSTYQSSLTGQVDYSGIDVIYANDMNRAFTEVFGAYETRYPLRNIKPFNMREKRFKGTTAEAAYQWGIQDMFYNKAYYKTPKVFAAHAQQAQDLLSQVLPHVDDLIASYVGDTSFAGKKKLTYMQALKATGRSNVYMADAYGATIHEMGHYLDDSLFHKLFGESGFDLSASFERYSGGISAYATADKKEYIAESFAAYWKGEVDILDPELVRIFEGARKK